METKKVALNPKREMQTRTSPSTDKQIVGPQSGEFLNRHSVGVYVSDQPASPPLSPNQILQLQRTIGNRAVRDLLGHVTPARQSIQREVILLDGKGRTYIKRGTPTADTILDWLQEKSNDLFKKYKENRELLEALCTSEDIKVTLDHRDMKQSILDLDVALTKIKSKMEQAVALPQNDNDDDDAPEGGSQGGSQLPGLNLLGPVAQASFTLEHLLTGTYNVGKNMSSKAQFYQTNLKSKGDEIIPLLEIFSTTLKSGTITYVELLHIKRLTSSYEWGVLASGIGEMQQLYKSVTNLSQKATPEGSNKDIGKLKLMHASISDLWTIEFVEFQEILTKVVRAEHGKTSTSAQASMAQIEETFGELLLCKPMLIMMNKLAPTHKPFYTWNLTTQIIKILQKTNRHHKIETLCDVIVSFDSIKKDLLYLMSEQRISNEAFIGIQKTLELIIAEGVTKKAKEQQRQLLFLTTVLMPEPQLMCTGYEAALSDSPPADIILKGRKQSAKVPEIVIEIEGMPNTQNAEAYTYLKNRYKDKYNKIGQFATKQGGHFYVAMPVGTIIPFTEWKKIKADDQLMIWDMYTWDKIFHESIQIPPLQAAFLKQKCMEFSQYAAIEIKSVDSKDPIESRQQVASKRLGIYKAFLNTLQKDLINTIGNAVEEKFIAAVYYPSTLLKGNYHEDQAQDPETANTPPVQLALEDLETLIVKVNEFIDSVTSKT